MKCVDCGAKAVFAHPPRCKDHFLSYVERTVQGTIHRFNLFHKSDRVCVAASGGKDSVALLVLLHSLGYRVEALAVDEGIEGYRDHSLRDLRGVCSRLGIPLRVVSFKDVIGESLDVMVSRHLHPCTVCGVFRRYVLNKSATGCDVVATGHNLDDESQAVLMNLSKANTSLLERTALRSPSRDGFVPRVKPLFFLSEREILAYVVLKGFSLTFGECPYAHLSFRARVRDVLNEYEYHHPGMKRSLVEAALFFAERSPSRNGGVCSVCGEPSAGDVCRACVLRGVVVRDS